MGVPYGGLLRALLILGAKPRNRTWRVHKVVEELIGHGDVVPFADDVVGAQGELVLRGAGRSAVDVVQAPRGGREVRQGIVREDLDGLRDDLRLGNLVVHDARIGNRRASGQIASTLRLGWHGASGGVHRSVAETFICSEYEGSVLLDRPSEGTPVVVPVERRDLRRAEEAPRVQTAVSVELEDGSVDLIRAGFGGDDYLAPGLPAVFRGIQTRKDTELLDAVHGGPDAGLSGRAVVVVDAVQHEVVRHLRAPGDIKSSAGAERGIRRGIADVRNQLRQVVKGPAVEGKFLDVLLVDHAAVTGGFGLHDGRRGGDQNLFGRGSQFQNEIQPRFLSDL